MAGNTWTIIQNRITAMSELNTRQDATANLLHWDDNPYKLVKPDGETELRDSISVTPNLPKVFAHGVIADLLSGKWQTKIEGNISSRQAHVIETFVDDNFAQADEFLLEKYGIPSLDGWLCNHVCVRWAIGVRWISQIIDGEYNIDCLPVDMRWTPFVLNRWVAPITFRTKEDWEVDLEKYAKRAESGLGEYTKISLGAGDIEGRDFWNNEKNEVWIDKKLVYAQKHNLLKPPFVIAIPATGFMLRDKGYLKHQGEDILFQNSGLYKELARSISLEQTSGYASLYPAWEREVKDEHWDSKPSKLPPELDSSQDVRTGERHQPVPRGDINRAGQTARVDILEMIGSVPTSPKQYNIPSSGLAIAGEQEMISRLQNARKDTLGRLKSQLARLMIDQFLNAKGEVSVGVRGKKSKYSTTKLGNPDDYTISYHLSVKSKRQELANLAEFVAAYDKLPLKWNLTNILMADDPAGIARELDLQQAREADPAIALSEMGVKYAEEAEDMEDNLDRDLKNFQSMLLIERAVSIIKQRQQPLQPALPKEAKVPEVKEPTGSGQLLSQLGGAGGAMRRESVRQPMEVL